MDKSLNIIAEEMAETIDEDNIWEQMYAVPDDPTVDTRPFLAKLEGLLSGSKQSS